MSCGTIPIPPVAGRTFAAQLVEPLYDEKALANSVAEFTYEFTFEFTVTGGADADFEAATIRDEAGFPLFDETPPTGEEITVTSVTKAPACPRYTFPPMGRPVV
jgi:hypothetical protein